MKAKIKIYFKKRWNNFKAFFKRALSKSKYLLIPRVIIGSLIWFFICILELIVMFLRYILNTKIEVKVVTDK